MHEDFLYYLWANQFFETQVLRTTEGDEVVIIHPGFRNEDSGPDFFNARIITGNVQWAGNIEIHVKASDWNLHHHGNDPAFDTVILHVVLEADIEIKRKDGSCIPTLELLGKFRQGLYEQYLDLIQGGSQWVSCEKQLNDIPEIIRMQCFDRMIAERLSEKAEQIYMLMQKTGNNTEETLYRYLLKYFGFRVNNIPFEMLASSLPWHVIAKHRDQLLQVEALMFGQAGFLQNDPADDYSMMLQAEYNHLKKKFNLVPIPVHLWKFGRLRPANFPTVRIAQTAMLFHKHDRLVNLISGTESFEELTQHLRVEPGSYWRRHYRPGQPAPWSNKKLGYSSAENLIINSIVPFVFAIGKLTGKPELSEKAIRWLENCNAEENKVIRGWKSAGVKMENACETQSALHLKKNYCDYKKCVNCIIGRYILYKHAETR